jgi:hypothetical protein
MHRQKNGKSHKSLFREFHSKIYLQKYLQLFTESKARRISDAELSFISTEAAVLLYLPKIMKN